MDLATTPPWAAPDRVDVPRTAPEREGLDAWLDYHRATLLVKCSGLDADQLVLRSCPPSTLSLLGLVRHLSEVERHWFRQVLAGSDVPDLYCSDEHPDGDFDLTDASRASEDLAAYQAELAACREIASTLDLNHSVLQPQRNASVSLRWVLNHMIEEYARHNGHADLIRQAIDGATGE